MRAPVQADLIQRKLFTVHYHMYASRIISPATRRPPPWKTSATTPSSSMAKRRRRKSGQDQLAAGTVPEEFPPPGCTGMLCASTTSPASCRRSKRVWGSAWCPTSWRPAASQSGARPAGGSGPRLRCPSGLCGRPAPIQAGGGIPGLPGEGFQGLAILILLHFLGWLETQSAHSYFLFPRRAFSPRARHPRSLPPECCEWGCQSIHALAAFFNGRAA